MKNKLFTLIELIVVIVVIGVLAAIVLPNISSMKEEATETAISNNQKNLQTAVDMFMLEHNGLTPTKGKPQIGEPKTLEIYGLHPDQIRSLPKNKGIHWWLDYNHTVWGSYVDTPKNTVISTDGTILSWDESNGATGYNIYKTTAVSVEGAGKGKGLKLVKAFTPTKNMPFQTSVEKVEDEIYLISAVDRYGFETVAVKANYKNEGYVEPDKEFEVEDSFPAPAPVKSKRILDEVPTGWNGIYTPEDLATMKKGNNYILMEDIDLNVEPYNEGQGWMPLSVTKFKLNGNGLSIKNLYINRPALDKVGLFRTLSSNSTLTDLNLVDVNVTGGTPTGGLIGSMFSGAIVERVSVTGTVNGYSNVGGIVGEMTATDSINRISQSFVDVKVNATRYAGAIFGIANYTTSKNQINDIYAFGEVNAEKDSGGLFGYIVGPYSLTNAYSLVHVKGNKTAPNNKYLYAFIGSNAFLGETIYWDYIATDTPNENSNSRQRRTTQQMQTQSNYIGWDFDTVWKIDEGKDYPRLRWEK